MPATYVPPTEGRTDCQVDAPLLPDTGIAHVRKQLAAPSPPWLGTNGWTQQQLQAVPDEGLNLLIRQVPGVGG